MEWHVSKALKASSTVKKWTLGAGYALGFTVLGSCAAEAVTITFNTAPLAATTVMESGFKVTPTRIVNGNCNNNPCITLNNVQHSDVTSINTPLFTLTDFWFKLLGNGSSNSLMVDTFGLGGVHLHQFVFATRNLRSNQAYLFSALGNAPQINLTKVVFSSVRGGNVRIDDIAVNAVSTVPIPTSLPLLISGLGFVSLFGRRRAKIRV
jgi:hypothetical protein